MTAAKSKPQVQPTPAPTTTEAGPPAQATGATKVQKIAAYPISIYITKVEGQPPLHGQILKLTELGFLMKVSTTHFYKVGETYPILFEIPVIGKEVRSVGKVIKTYDAIETASKTQTTKMYTIEMHFKNLSVQEKLNINNYLVKSGQKKF